MGFEYSQADYDERKQRQNDGLASDEDRRLIKQYEQAGFVETRLKGEQAPAEDATSSPDVAPPGERDNRDKWVAFALAVNEHLAPDDRPIDDPENATKVDLMAGYREFAEGD